MPEKEIISLDQAQMAAEGLWKANSKILKNRRGQSETRLHRFDLIYDIDGIATIGGGLISKGNDSRLKSRSRRLTALSSL